jgi:hypothetical protein
MSESTTAEATEATTTEAPASIPTPKDVASLATPPVEAQKTEIWQDPEAARREIEKLRKENGDARIQAKAAAAEEAQQKAIAAFAKAMGIEIPGDEKPTVESLTEKLNQTSVEAEQTKAEASRLKVEMAVIKEAAKQRVDVDKLTNSRSFYENITSLDPTAEDFEAAVQSAIEAEVEKDRTLKATGGPAKSGAETYGGTGDQQAITKEQFEAMSLDEKTQLFRTNRSEFDRLANA